MKRRKFITSTGITTIGFMGLYQMISNPLLAVEKALSPAIGYGPLIKDPKGIINLPKGFTYAIISRTGDAMDDGFRVPAYPDGMGAFKGKNGRTIVVRNHETETTHSHGAFGENNILLEKSLSHKLYDYGGSTTPALGGTSTFIYDAKTRKIEKQYLSLAGTIRNCAGGPTPWNSWLTCEESTIKAGHLQSMEKDHGYVFEVPASETIGLADPVPIKSMGRMNHEAVAVDPHSGIVYLTEDMGDSLIYRYIPDVPGQLHKGGKLEALAVRGQKSRDTRNWEKLGTPLFPMREPFEVEWIPLENVESPANDLRLQGYSKGAAVFARGEGMWYGNNEVYFACTNGGKKSNGQVFRYRPSGSEGKKDELKNPGRLELFVESEDTAILKHCDNLTVSPWGDVILCEDDSHPFLVGVTPDGKFYKLAENTGYESEFAGGVFSPAGETYFVNIQGEGITLAITGPWNSSVKVSG